LINRRQILGTIAATAGCSAFGGQAAAAAEQSPVVDPAVVGNPCLFNPDPTRVGVVWRIHQHGAGAVEYGTTEKLGQTATVIRHGLCQRDDTVPGGALPYPVARTLKQRQARSKWNELLVEGRQMNLTIERLKGTLAGKWTIESRT